MPVSSSSDDIDLLLAQIEAKIQRRKKDIHAKSFSELEQARAKSVAAVRDAQATHADALAKAEARHKADVQRCDAEKQQLLADMGRLEADIQAAEAVVKLSSDELQRKCVKILSMVNSRLASADQAAGCGSKGSETDRSAMTKSVGNQRDEIAG
ncbi:hypothetical protein HK105_201122 [Polyrhizophydium stewartii]|uniref:Uncharacterized protein n=1 Tax=Polyrhizophydium stewartii TaxID=2732419 RepID=A0ABR4NIW0_9FUNG